MRQKFGALTLLCGMLCAGAPAEPEEGTRQLWNKEFRQLRPKNTGTPAAKAPAAKARADAIVGVTVWLLRESKPEDDKAVRIASPAGGVEYTPVRVDADTPLAQGQKVRVGIESARGGYLYVIDREQYADGSLGPPYLIFPLQRTRAGKNRVAAGRLVEIPGIEDNPFYFTMRTSRPDQVAEVLTVLVTPEPLAEVPLARNPVELSAGKVQAWEKQWAARVQRLPARGEAGKLYTRAEKEAALTGTRLLTYDEALPQVLYRVEAKPGDPLLLKVPLRIAR